MLKCPDEGAVIEALADYLASDIRDTLGRQACYRWALAGGSTPGRLYRRLAQPGVTDLLDWRRMRLFWGDERCVPPGDPQSNYRMVRESLLDHVPIPAGNIFPIDGTLDPERSAEAYAEVLGEEPLDCVLLGIGEDGHTASLFPGTPRLREESKTVIATRSPLPPVHRVSLLAAHYQCRPPCVFSCPRRSQGRPRSPGDGSTRAERCSSARSNGESRVRLSSLVSGRCSRRAIGPEPPYSTLIEALILGRRCGPYPASFFTSIASTAIMSGSRLDEVQPACGGQIERVPTQCRT